MAVFQPIPWIFDVDDVHFWIHYGFVILGFLLAVISTIVQFSKPAPYGRHQDTSPGWGPLINQRLGHIVSDLISGVILFLLVYFLYGSEAARFGYANQTFLWLWQAHYIHRGLIHPLVMKYSRTEVSLGITLGGLFPNLIFSFICSDWIGSAVYDSNYYYDPRFLLGVIFFVVGFCINKWSDWKLRSLRSSSDTQQYHIPYGGLFELISCPNYFGEMLEWIGWALGTWSLAGCVWLLFGCSTFIPRARHHHIWYQQQFPEYPSSRKILIPFLY
ncbi:3-oxo-5-alpha-steroid 4-dehydrogenase 1-like [Glandiceps talaboti]